VGVSHHLGVQVIAGGYRESRFTDFGLQAGPRVRPVVHVVRPSRDTLPGPYVPPVAVGSPAGRQHHADNHRRQEIGGQHVGQHEAPIDMPSFKDLPKRASEDQAANPFEGQD
jgi:hypothetical protein